MLTEWKIEKGKWGVSAILWMCNSILLCNTMHVDKVACICWFVIDIIHLLGMCFDITQEVGRDWGCYRLTQLHYLIWCLFALILLYFFFLPFPHFVFLCVFLTFILTDQAILYLSRFIKVETLKEKLLRNNKETYWVPDFVKVLYLSATMTAASQKKLAAFLSLQLLSFR